MNQPQQLPAELKLSPIQRALADAVGLAQRGDHDANPAWDAAITSMASEFKALRKKSNLLYIGTALGAFLILAQHGTKDISVEAAGLKLPLSAFSNQALAVLLAGAYGYYAAAIISAGMLYGAMIAVFQRAAPEGWEFLMCRYDADMLWTNLLRPKRYGYTAITGETILSALVRVSNTSVVLSHTALVLGTIIVSGLAALHSKSYFGLALAGLALVGALGAAIGALSALCVKLTYRAPQAATAPVQP